MQQCRFTPVLVSSAGPCRPTVSSRWFVDETYVKVSGIWRCDYRTFDEQGQVIDVFVSKERDTKAATRFFGDAIGVHARRRRSPLIDRRHWHERSPDSSRRYFTTRRSMRTIEAKPTTVALKPGSGPYAA